jgi:isopenicillin N synthase-like dioxygenase
MFYLMLRPSDSRNLRFWPSNPPSFRDSIDVYSSEAAKLVSCLLRFVAMDMGVEPESLLERFRGQPQSMRMTYTRHASRLKRWSDCRRTLMLPA